MFCCCVSFWLVYQRSEWETVSLFFFFCQVEVEEEEKSGETVQAPPDGSVTPSDEVSSNVGDGINVSDLNIFI